MEDFFALLGLPRQYGLDVAEVRRRFLIQSRAVHPDRFVSDLAATQAQALDRSSLLNRAYQTLLDPQRRLEHLLQLEGLIDAAGQTTHRLSTAFMSEVMDLGEAAAEGPAARETLRHELTLRLQNEWAVIEASLLAAPSPLPVSVLSSALEALLQRRTLQRVLEQVTN